LHDLESCPVGSDQKFQIKRITEDSLLGEDLLENRTVKYLQPGLSLLDRQAKEDSRNQGEQTAQGPSLPRVTPLAHSQLLGADQDIGPAFGEQVEEPRNLLCRQVEVTVEENDRCTLGSSGARLQGCSLAAVPFVFDNQCVRQGGRGLQRFCIRVVVAAIIDDNNLRTR
jgi:hypothetical protein